MLDNFADKKIEQNDLLRKRNSGEVIEAIKSKLLEQKPREPASPSKEANESSVPKS